jgi:hypothetical protein
MIDSSRVFWSDDSVSFFIMSGVDEEMGLVGTFIYSTGQCFILQC